MASLIRSMLVAGCLAASLSSSAHAQFSFPYTSEPTQQTVHPVIENRSVTTEQYVHTAEKHAHKSHKNVAAH